jgi:hypothetical protein
LFKRDSLSSTIGELMTYLIVEVNGHYSIHDVLSRQSIDGALSTVQSVENTEGHEEGKKSEARQYISQDSVDDGTLIHSLFMHFYVISSLIKGILLADFLCSRMLSHML